MTDDPNAGGSGLELDDKRPPPGRRRSARAPSAAAQSGAAPMEVGGRPRFRKRTAEDDELPTDSTTAGAFIVLALAHLGVGLVLAVGAPHGDALPTLAIVLASAVISFVFYYVTGFLVHHFGVIALIVFGGWFSLLVGFAAQLVHRLLPWLGWKVLAVAVAGGLAVAYGLDMR